MQYERVLGILDDSLDELAAVEHARWSHWQRYVHSKRSRQADGSLLLPADLVARWEAQIATNYEDLTDEEKESDCEQLRRYIPSIADVLSERLPR